MNLIDSLIYVLAQISEKYMYMWCLRSNTHKIELLFHQAIHHYIAQFDLILNLTTLTIEFYSKDICVDHFLHPRYIIPVTLVDIFQLWVGQNSKKLKFSDVAPLDLIMTFIILIYKFNGVAVDIMCRLPSLSKINQFWISLVGIFNQEICQNSKNQSSPILPHWTLYLPQ